MFLDCVYISETLVDYVSFKEILFDLMYITVTLLNFVYITEILLDSVSSQRHDIGPLYQTAITISHNAAFKFFFALMLEREKELHVSLLVSRRYL